MGMLIEPLIWLERSLLQFSRGAFFDTLRIILALEDGVHEDAGSMNLVGIELAGFDEMFDFGDYKIGGGGHHGIKVARSFSIDEIAPAVALPGFDESEVPTQGAFQNEMAAIEFAGFLIFGDRRAKPGRRVEGRNSGATGAQAFGKGALRIEFDLQFAAQDQALEEFIFSHVAGDHFFNLAILQEQANAEIVDSGVVADNREVFSAFSTGGDDEIFWDSAKAESAHENGHAIAQIGEGCFGVGDAFVHERVPRGEVYCKIQEPGS